MFRILPLIALCMSPIGAAETWWRSFGGIKAGDFAGGHHDTAGNDPEELKAFLKQAKFDEWATHEDEFVRISYPKHPLLKLEVQGGNTGIEVEGGVCTTVDNSFQKAYVLKAGSATYGVFLLSPAPWLDDGICFCGPMVHHVYRVEDGCLARFSLLPGGAVKKAQLLGGKLRLMAFEWTHLACPRDIYEEMVERMTLKVPHTLDEAALHQEIKRRYGPEGLSGLIHPGTSLEAANAIMGSEAVVKEGIATWNFDATFHLKALFATGEPAWIRAAAKCAPEMPADFAQTAIHKALETAIKNRDGELVELALESIGLTKLPDPLPLIPLVESLPDGEPESDWAKAKQQALADLRAPKGDE